MILIDYEETFVDLLASSPIFPELDVWLANDSEQHCTQQPSALGSSDPSKAVSLETGEVFIVLLSAPCIKEVFCAVNVPCCVAGIKVVIHHPKISAVLIIAAKYSVISFLPVKHLPPL